MTEHCSKCNTELSDELVAEYNLAQQYFNYTVIPMLCTDYFDVAIGKERLQ